MAGFKSLPLLFFMRSKLSVTIIILLLFLTASGQQRFCADSSIRVKYVFGAQGATLYNNPDTTGKNIFTGGFTEGLNGGLALLKTTWGDSMIWAKKIYMPGGSFNSFAAPNGSFVCTGAWGPPAVTEFLISKFDTNGTVQWIKRFRFNPIHLKYNPENWVSKNILVTNNAIYFNALFNNYYNVIAKLDLDGNILWSKSFTRNLFWDVLIIDAPVFYNNNIFFTARLFEPQSSTTPKKLYNAITKLNDADGSVIETNSYKPIIDSLGLFTNFFKYNNDNTFSLTGFLGVADVNGVFGFRDIIFNAQLDAGLNLIHNYYYKNNLILDPLDIYFDFNNQSQHTFLTEESGNHNNKYFVTFDKNDEVLRSRKFTISSIFASIYSTSVNLDDKQNLHFLFHYPQGSQLVTEYARISDFAPSSTVTCFGKDTSILTKYNFSLTKEPFTWDNVTSDVLISNPVPYTEDTAIVTKQLVCKIVSYCDSVHISGPATACINQPVRYTVTKNASCLKSLQWNIDTTIATIINTEADTAITLSFKRAFTGYIHAAVYNCVVNDSFFVTVTAPKILRLIKRDSLLCPGKSIVLKAATGFAAYRWQDGSTADTLKVTAPGFYKITGTDFCGFKSSDSIVVQYADTSFNIPAAETICLNDTAFIILPADVVNITWQPVTNALLNNKTLLLYPKQTTVYRVMAERLANCPLTKTNMVNIENCLKTVFIPNAFTPDGNGNNDKFKATATRPLQYFSLVVYNRYGQKVFETTDLAKGWDGNFKNTKQPSGGYVYSCTYGFTGRPLVTENNYFLLIR